MRKTTASGNLHLKCLAVSLLYDLIFLEENVTCALLRDCWYLHTLTQINTTQCCFPKPSLDAGMKTWKL